MIEQLHDRHPGICQGNNSFLNILR